MKKRLLIALTLVASCALGSSNMGPSWRIAGDFGEVCSCSVPCTCNFGEGPSPKHFCWAMFTLDIKEGDYDGIKLSGMRSMGALAQKGFVIYIDSKATHQQAEALKAIWTHIGESVMRANGITDMNKAPEGMKFLGFQTAEIQYSQDDAKMYCAVPGVGAFGSKYILGIDGKTPVRMENNWSWNLTECIKAKSSVFRYKDSFGQSMEFKETNSNVGKFDWSDQTKLYFR